MAVGGEKRLMVMVVVMGELLESEVAMVFSENVNVVEMFLQHDSP